MKSSRPSSAAYLLLSILGLCALGTQHLHADSTLSGTGTLTLGNGVLNGTGANTNPIAWAGDITGTLTINAGATVQAGSAWGLGYQSNASVTAIAINGGTLAFGETNILSGGTAARTITLRGGTITTYGAAATSPTAAFDWYEGGAIDATTNNNYGLAVALGSTNNPVLATLPSSTVSVVADGVSLRLGAVTNSLIISNAVGTTPSGIDLIISGSLQTPANGINDAFAGLVKTGPGVTELSGSNNYNGPTTVNQGTIVIANNSALSTNPVSLTGGGIDTFNGSTNTLPNTVNVSGGGFIGVGSGSSLTLGAINLGGNSTINLDNSNSVLKTTGSIVVSGTNNVISLGGTYSSGTYTLLSKVSGSLTPSSLTLKGSVGTIPLNSRVSNCTFTNNAGSIQLIVK